MRDFLDRIYSVEELELIDAQDSMSLLTGLVTHVLMDHKLRTNPRKSVLERS